MSRVERPEDDGAEETTALVRGTRRSARPARRGGAEEAVRTLTVVVAPSGRAGRRAGARSAREAERRLRRSEQEHTETGAQLPTVPRRRRWGRWGRRRMWGPVSVATPAHVTSAARAGILTTLLAPPTMQVPGPVIGLETSSLGPFTFDMWGAYLTKLTTSVCMLVAGLQGSGKSFGTKVVMIREVGAERQVIISSDPDGEWAPIARAMGGQVVPLGPGTGVVICPLDEGVRPSDTDTEEWNRVVALRRSQALASICAILRPSRPLDEYEQACLDTVVSELAAGRVTPTIAAVTAWLEDPPPDVIERVGDQTPARLALVLGRLVSGPMSGMFDGCSTVDLDPGAPMIVVDTSALSGVAPEVRAIATACTSAWIDATLRSRDGRWRVVVSEEAWDELRNPAQAQAMDERIRLAGHLRCSTVLIIHELKDTEIFGGAGSAHRAQVERILAKCAIKVLYRQSSDSMPAVHRIVGPTAIEAELLPTLPQGVGVWHIGTAAPVMVQPIVGPTGYALINTDSGRTGQ